MGVFDWLLGLFGRRRGDLLYEIDGANVQPLATPLALTKAFPDIAKDHLYVLFQFALAGAASTGKQDDKSFVVDAVFALCEQYRKGGLSVRRRGKKYGVYLVPGP